MQNIRKKSILLILLTIVILLIIGISRMSYIAYAETGVEITYDNKKVTFDIPLTNELIQDNYVSYIGYSILPAGNYYIPNCGTFIPTYKIEFDEGTTNLCLNGQVFKLNGDINAKGALNIYDTSNTKHYFLKGDRWTLTTSASGIPYKELTGNEANGTIVEVEGGIITGEGCLNAFDKLNIYGANIVGLKKAIVTYCEIEFPSNKIVKQAVCNLVKGSILGCESDFVILNRTDVVNIYKDFAIMFNKSIHGTIYAGGDELTTDICKVNIYGGKISNNHTTHDGCITITTGSVCNIYDGELSNNVGPYAVVELWEATINMYGGSIINNIGEYNGAGISNTSYGSVINLFGGRIEGNYAYYGAGVINHYGELNIAGDIVVANNIGEDNEPCNICLEGNPINIIENSKYKGLTKGANVHITTSLYDYYVSNYPQQLTSASGADYSKYITLDYENVYLVSKKKISGKKTTYTLYINGIEITQEPSANNNYTIEAKTTDEGNISYQWCKREYVDLNTLGEEEYSFYGERIGEKDIRISTSYGYPIQHYFIMNSTGFAFDCDSNAFAVYKGTLIQAKNGHYLVEADEGEVSFIVLKELVIKNIELYNDVALEGQNTNKLGNIEIEDKEYFCRLSTENYSEISNIITPTKVSFNGNGGKGTNPSPILQFAGRTISLPENPYKNGNEKFYGWSKGNTTYVTGYRVGTKDVTLLANWTGIVTPVEEDPIEEETIEEDPIEEPEPIVEPEPEEKTNTLPWAAGGALCGSAIVYAAYNTIKGRRNRKK